MELVIEDSNTYSEIVSDLKKLGREDLLCAIPDEDIPENFVQKILEKYPIKKISTKVYKANVPPNFH